VSEYRRLKCIEGSKFERLFAKEFQQRSNKHTVLTPCITKNDQINFGDFKELIECKYDMRMANTGNLFIECYEKQPGAIGYVKSGILAKSKAEYYVQGNFSCIYVFLKVILQEYVSKFPMPEEFKNTERWRFGKTEENNTAYGFILPIKEAEELAPIIWEIDTTQQLLDVTKRLKEKYENN